MLPPLGPFLPPSRSSLSLLDDGDVGTALSIFRNCMLEVVNSSFSEHWSMTQVFPLLLGEMLNVARYRPHGGKLTLWCQGSYVWSTRTKKNLLFDRPFHWNSNANCTSWLDGYYVFDVRSWQWIVRNITRQPVRRRICFFYLVIMRYQLSFTSTYACKPTTKQHHTNLLQNVGPLEWSATCSDTW